MFDAPGSEDFRIDFRIGVCFVAGREDVVDGGVEVGGEGEGEEEGGGVGGGEEGGDEAWEEGFGLGVAG